MRARVREYDVTLEAIPLTLVTVAIRDSSSAADLSAHLPELLRRPRSEQLRKLIEQPHAVMLQELATEGIGGEVRQCELASFGCLRVALRVQLVPKQLEICWEVVLVDHVVIHLAINLPETHNVSNEQCDPACRHAKSQNKSHDKAKENIFEHVVVYAKHHGQRQHEEERAGTADAKHKVKLRGEAQLVDCSERVIDRLVVGLFQALPPRRPVLVPVSGVLHVLVHLPAVEQLLNVEDEDVHDNLEWDNDETEEQVDD